MQKPRKKQNKRGSQGPVPRILMQTTFTIAGRSVPYTLYAARYDQGGDSAVCSRAVYGFYPQRKQEES